MNKDWQKLRSTWQTLGEDDPLWAVASEDDKKGNQWKDEEFLQSAEPIIARYRSLLETEGAKLPFEDILDFGCGAGRLSAAWAPYGDRVTGIDISASMLKKARDLVKERPNITFVLNERPDLSIFADESFNLVFSHICLQHIPPKICKDYLREFSRICRKGGWVAFQLPASLPWRVRMADLRKFLVELVPFGFAEAYRSKKHGRRANYSVYAIPKKEVASNLLPCRLMAAESDISAGDDVESYIYIFQKP